MLTPKGKSIRETSKGRKRTQTGSCPLTRVKKKKDHPWGKDLPREAKKKKEKGFEDLHNSEGLNRQHVCSKGLPLGEKEKGKKN